MYSVALFRASVDTEEFQGDGRPLSSDGQLLVKRSKFRLIDCVSGWGVGGREEVVGFGIYTIRIGFSGRCDSSTADEWEE